MWRFLFLLYVKNLPHFLQQKLLECNFSWWSLQNPYVVNLKEQISQNRFPLFIRLLITLSEYLSSFNVFFIFCNWSTIGGFLSFCTFCSLSLSELSELSEFLVFKFKIGLVNFSKNSSSKQFVTNSLVSAGFYFTTLSNRYWSTSSVKGFFCSSWFAWGSC